MRKLLLSFLVIGATVFTSCDKGDDMMTPVQVAADVQSLSIDVVDIEDPFAFEDADDYNVENSVSGRTNAPESVNGWSLFKTGVTKKGFAKYYYGTDATYARKNGKKRKVTVVVLSFNKTNGNLNQYSIRHNDVKIIRQRILREAGVFESTVKGVNYGGDDLPELISNVIGGITGQGTGQSSKGSSSARTRTYEDSPRLSLESYGPDSDGDGWNDFDESALARTGWAKENGDLDSQYYAKGAFILAFEPGNTTGSYGITGDGGAFFHNHNFASKPFYFDGVSRGYTGEQDFSAIHEVIGSLSIYTAPEVAALHDAGLTPVSDTEAEYHIVNPVADGYLNIEKHGDGMDGIIYNVNDGEIDEVYEDHTTLQVAIDHVLSLLSSPEDDGFFDTPADDSDSGYSGAGVGSNRQFANGRQEQMLAAGFIPSGGGSRFTQDDVILTYRYINGVDWIFIATPSRTGASGRAYADERFGDALVYAVSLLPTTIDFEGRGQDLLDAGFTFTGESSDRFNYSNRYATLSLFKDGVTITVTSDTNAHATYRDYNRFALAVAYANSFIRFEISTIEQNFLGVHGFTLQDNDESFLYYGPEGIALFIDRDGERIYTVVGGEGVVDYDSIGAAVHAANESLALTFVQERTLAERFPSLVRTEIGGAIYYENSVVRLVAFGDGITVTNKASGADHVFLRSELGGQNRVWIAVYAELIIYI